MSKAIPACPRCGYDQSGAIAFWERESPPQCPVRGLCTECGLAFDWADVFRPALHDVPWLYEHARRWSLGVDRLVRTWFRVIGARGFWRRVGVRQRTSVPRLLLWMLIVLAPLHLMAGWLVARQHPFAPLWWQAADGLLAPFASLNMNRWRLVVEWRLDSVPAFVLITPVVATVWPLLMLILGTSRSRAALRPGHLLRAWVYSLWWLPLAEAVRLVALVGVRQFGGMVEYGLWTAVRYAEPLILIALLAWTCWWWRCAVRDGWKLERGGTIWALLGAAAVLSGVILAALNLEVVAWLLRNRIL